MGRHLEEMIGIHLLTQWRLQGVRAELLLARANATVQAVAMASGFANLGLFARVYRQRFGELPSATLKSQRP